MKGKKAYTKPMVMNLSGLGVVGSGFLSGNEVLGICLDGSQPYSSGSCITGSSPDTSACNPRGIQAHYASNCTPSGSLVAHGCEYGSIP